MGRKALTYTAVLIGTYLVLARATGFGKVMSSSASAYVKSVKALQGR
jgi:hypothetical protein